MGGVVEYVKSHLQLLIPLLQHVPQRVDPGLWDTLISIFNRLFFSELILSMLNVCYSTDEDVKSLQTQAYIPFVDFLDMCACTLHASWNLVRVVYKKGFMFFFYPAQES